MIKVTILTTGGIYFITLKVLNDQPGVFKISRFDGGHGFKGAQTSLTIVKVPTICRQNFCSFCAALKGALKELSGRVPDNSVLFSITMHFLKAVR